MPPGQPPRRDDGLYGLRPPLAQPAARRQRAAAQAAAEHRRPDGCVPRCIKHANRRLTGPGNTPLHLALESAHAEVAVLLIEAGADRSRVRSSRAYRCLRAAHFVPQENLDSETPEQLAGVGGLEQRRALAYIVERCGAA
jgi:hypothetical protein